MALTLEGIKRPHRNRKASSNVKKKKPLPPFKREGEGDQPDSPSSFEESPSSCVDTPLEAVAPATRDDNQPPTPAIKNCEISNPRESQYLASSERKQNVNSTETECSLKPVVLGPEIPEAEEGLDSCRDIFEGNGRKQNVNKTEEQPSCLRNQSVNNLQAITHIGQQFGDDYVNSTATERKQHSSVYVNNAETNEQISKSNIVQNISNPDNDNKLDSLPVYVNNTETVRKQDEGVSKKREQYVNSSDTKDVPIRKQSVNSTETERKQINVHVLGRGELSILKFLHSMSVRNGGVETPEIRYHQIADSAGIKTAKSAKTYVQRLVNRGFISRVQFTKGPSAWTKFSIDKVVHEKLLLFGMQSGLEYSTETIRKQNDNNTGTQRVTRAETEVSSKLVSNYINTNYTKKDELLEFYENTDFSIVNESDVYISNGFTKEKIIGEIAKNEWTIKPADLEEVLVKFNSYCSEQKNIHNVNSIRGFFFGQLKKLHKGEFLDIEGAETEDMKRLKAIRQKQLAEKAIREQLKEEIKTGAFEEWWDATLDDAKTELYPQMMGMRGKLPEDTIRGSIRALWEQKIWPTTDDYDELEKLLQRK